MSTKKDGGQAFTVPSTGTWVGNEGMTLRDWFAGMVLSGAMALPDPNISKEEEAAFAYLMADAMLKEREK